MIDTGHLYGDSVNAEPDMRVWLPSIKLGIKVAHKEGVMIAYFSLNTFRKIYIIVINIMLFIYL